MAAINTFLVIFVYMMVAICFDEYTLENPIKITVEEAMIFTILINSIQLTAQESMERHRDIQKIYKNVYGPMQIGGIRMGELVVGFDQSGPEFVSIALFKDGYQYLQLEIDANTQNAEIEYVEQIPNELSGTQLMIFATELLSRLNIKQAALADLAKMKYQEEEISLNVLFAIHGKTKGWYESLGFMNGNNQQQIVKSMQDLYNYLLPKRVTMRGRLIKEFTHRRKLGEVMSHYWKWDKCLFTRLYKALMSLSVFTELAAKSGGTKVKKFAENIHLPPTNMFYATSSHNNL